MSSRPLSDNAVYRWKYAAGLVLCVVGAAIGLRLPDFDQAFNLPPLVVHRSLLSHGFLFPLLLLIWTEALSRKKPEGVSVLFTHPHADPRLRWFSLGVCTGTAVHLCFDLFPSAWHGYALIYAPIWGRLSGMASLCWLLGSLAACLYFGCRLIRRKAEMAIALGTLGACYGVHAAYEPGKAVYAFFVLAFVAFVALLLPRPVVRGANGGTDFGGQP